MDFIYEKGEDITIVECKSSNTRATGMKFVPSHHERFGEHKAVKYADANIGEGEGFKTYPLYALVFLKKEEKHMIVDFPDPGELKVPGKTEE